MLGSLCMVSYDEALTCPEAPIVPNAEMKQLTNLLHPMVLGERILGLLVKLVSRD